MTGQIITTNGKKIILNRTFLETPTILAPTQFKIGTGTTDPTLGDTDLETPVNINGTAFKDFVSSYPLLDTTNIQSTIRCFVNSVEANGNTLTEFGIVNEDGTPLLFSRAVFSGIAKTSSNEITFIQKDKIL